MLLSLKLSILYL